MEKAESVTPIQSQLGVSQSQIVESQGVKLRRGRQPGYKLGDPPRKKRRTADSCIKNQCLIDVAMRFFHLRVLKLLNAEHIKWLTRTPFMHLFAFAERTQVSNAILYEILLMWDNKGHFKVRDGKLLKFSAEDVAIVMGLNKKGSIVHYRREFVTNYRLRSAYFRDTGKITRVDLENAILKAINEKKPEVDVVGLLVMYLFTTILFPQACGNVPVHMFSYVEKLDELHGYNWSDGVYTLLMENIPNNAIWCKLKRDGNSLPIVQDESSQEDGSRKNKSVKASGTLPGCAIALIVSYKFHVLIVLNMDVLNDTGKYFKICW